MINSKKQNLILNLIYVTFVFSLLYLFGLGINIKLSILFQFTGVLVGSALVKFFLFNPLILYVILALGLIIAVIVHRFYTPVLTITAEKIYFFLDNIYNNLKGNEYIRSEYVLYFWILLLVLIAFYTAFILFKNKNIYLLLPVYILSFLYYWYNFYDEAYILISIFLFAFILLIGYKKYLSTKTNYPWMKSLVIYCVLIISIAMILPKSNDFFHWPKLQKWVYAKFPGIEGLRTYDAYKRNTGEISLFNFSSTGFQNYDSRLGGPVKLSNEKIMVVQSDGVNYLRGNVKHIYIGNSWRGLILDSEEYKTGQRFRGIPSKDVVKYFKERFITITNLNFASNTVFSPYRPESMIIQEKEKIFITADDVLLFPDGVYEGESYTIKVQEPKPYGVLLAHGISLNKEEIDDLDIYLQIPQDKITNRTRSLVRKIIENANTDYEKSLAIEEYLRNNYKYNLDVGDLPENHEFVDYFLFEEKQGYCTYYATAMAIMLRLEGIPSRYIEGFIAKDRSEPGVYIVKHENAHAWVEAFIEPVGWMTFEPTPVYDVQPRMEDYVLEDESDRLPNQVPDGVIGGIFDVDDINRPDDEIINEGEILKGDEQSHHDGELKNDNHIYIIIILSLLILPMRFLIGFLYYYYKENKARGLSNNEKAIYLYKQIMKLTELFGWPQLHGETHYEYASRVANKFYYQDGKGIKEITHIFVKSKYGSTPTSDEDILEMEVFRKTLDKHLKSKIGVITYYYKKSF